MATKPLRSIKFPGLTDTYTVAATDTTLTIAGEPADAKATGDALATKADSNGSYEGLTVGSAEQLLATTGAEDRAPYLQRQTGGGVTVGDRAEEKIVGGTSAWNQLVDSGTTSVTLTSTYKYISFIGGTWTCGESDGTALAVTGGTDMVFDLTQMFRSAVANAVYAMDQATAGAGVAWFRAMFPESYYPYNAGELMSVQTSGKTATSADNTVVKTYPLDSSLILRGIPKWDSVKGTMYYDGDEYTSDGRVKWKVMHLALTPAQASVKQTLTNTKYYRFANIFGGHVPEYYNTTGYNGAFCLAVPYVYNTTDTPHYYVEKTGVSMYLDKTQPEPETVVVEILMSDFYATDPADPYTGTQWVEAGGTEAFIDAGTETGRVAVPVGHDTFYPTDLRGGLETLLETDLAHADAIAPVQGGTASTNIASGELLMQDGKLYKATQAIVAGAEISATNTTLTTIAAQLAALEARIAALEN